MQRLCRQVPGARHRGIQLVPYVAKQTVYKTGKLASPQQQQQQQAGSVVLPSRAQQGLQEEAASEPQYETANREAWEWMSWWDSIPSRYKLVVATSVSFMLSNADKVILSVAILPMAAEYGWSPTVAGVVQSSFFWGYMLSQLPSGYANSTFGGRRVLPAGVLLWSGATAVVPWAAAAIPTLTLSRAAVGFGEAIAPSAATDMVARSALPTERARSITFIFSGLHVGSIVGLLATPWLVQHAGWRSSFVLFGSLGIVWWAWFEKVVMARISQEEPEFASRLIGQYTPQANPSASANAAAASTITASGSSPVGSSTRTLTTSSSGSSSHSLTHGSHNADGSVATATGAVPWRAFLRSTCVRNLAYTHFANNWFHYVFLAWLPTYFVDTLSVDLMHASQTALLPPLAGIAASAAAGAGTDVLIGQGMSVGKVRKLAQGIAFLIPTALLLAVCSPEVAGDSTLTVAGITLALGVSSFSLAGLFCTHQDLSPKYAPILLGLTNTTAAIPGVLGVASVGFLYDKTESWEAALFLPSAFFMATAAIAYTFGVKNEQIDFDAADNSNFQWENRVAEVKAAVLGAWRKVQMAVGQRGEE